MKKIKNNPWEQWYNERQINIKYPTGSCYDSLKETSNLYPNYKAYNYFGIEKDYNELVKEIDNIAKSLSRIGVKKGDYVTICSSNVPEAILSFYAINKIGAIANMVHPKTSLEELEYFLDLTESHIIIALDSVVQPFMNSIEKTKVKTIISFGVFDSAPESMKNLIPSIDLKSEKINIISFKEFYELGTNLEDSESVGKANDCCAVLYSGGTTGKPKGVMLSNMNLNALAYGGFYANDSLEAGDSMLAVMPIFHGFGLGICIHTSFCFALRAILQPKLDVQNFDKLIIDYKPNMITGVPTIYEFLLQSKRLDNVDLSFLKWVSSGGDSLSTSMKHKINDFLLARNSKVLVKEGYGLTECVTGTCLMPKNIDRDGSIGIPYADTTYKIVEPNTFNELNYGEVGEIAINAPTIMLGYLGNEEETKKALRKDEDGKVWFYTGDLGYIDEEGFVYYKQRMKRIIICSGYNVYPEQIEEAIESNPKVLVSSVVGIPNKEKGEIPVAFIVRKTPEDKTEELLNAIKQSVESKISKYAIPRDYVFMEKLPKTAVGKIDYQSLIKEYLKK